MVRGLHVGGPGEESSLEGAEAASRLVKGRLQRHRCRALTLARTLMGITLQQTSTRREDPGKDQVSLGEVFE